MIDKIIYEIDKLPLEIKQYFEHFFQVSAHTFLKKCKIVTIKADDRFISAGEEAKEVWICISGSVKAMEEFKSGAIYVYTEFPAPGIYGEMEALADIPLYRSSLVAVTDCVFIVGPIKEYIGWIQKDINALYERTQDLSRRLMEEGRSNRAYLLLDGMERIKVYLIDYYTYYKDNEVCVLRNTRQQISDETGYSVKTINRVIKKLTEQGFLSIERQRITITKSQYKRILESIDEKVKYKQ